MSLLVVQNDREYVQVRRRGRFSMEMAQAADGQHRILAVRLARQKMIRDMASRGFQYIDDGRDELQGPLPHIEFSEDSRPDMAHLAAPSPLDLAGNQRFEHDEKTRQAKDMPLLADMVDFRLVATFRKATGLTFRSAVNSLRR